MKVWYNQNDKSEFVDELLELSLFFEVFRDSYRKMRYIFPYFCPYRKFTRAGFYYTTIAKRKIGCYLARIYI